jgi:prepilin peptidase CpaA
LIHSVPMAIRVGLGLFVLAAAVYDLRFRRIPNWLNLSGIILGFGFNALLFQLSGTAKAGEGMLLAFAIYLPLYLLRGMGAGDVKLMAAVGALVGPGNWVEIFIATALLGGATAGLFALAKGRLQDTLCNLHFLVKDLACLRAPYRTNPQLDFRRPGSLTLPHGVSIALGSCFFLACVTTGNRFLSQILAEIVFRVF